jgi:hypothetical protein
MDDELMDRGRQSDIRHSQQEARMATPNFVKFSRIHGETLEVLERLDKALREPWQSPLREVIRLKPSYDDFDGGLELDGDFRKCESPRDAIEMAAGSDAFGLVYSARKIPADFCFYLFDIGPGEFSVTSAFESSIVYYKNDEFDSGEWLEGLLTSIVCALKPLVCGYGCDDAYRCRHESLNPDAVLARLRTGELLGLPRPIFHAIATSLIDKSEIDALIAQYNPAPILKYRMAPGYNILSKAE